MTGKRYRPTRASESGENTAHYPPERPQSRKQVKRLKPKNKAAGVL